MNNPERKISGPISFALKSYIVLASVGYSYWIYNLPVQLDGRTESFAIKETFNTLLIGFNISIFGLVALSVFHFVRKQRDRIGWNLLFVGYALVWILFLAPLHVR